MNRQILSFFLLSTILLNPFNLSAQIIFSEDFQNGMPPSFTLINVDGRTPESGVSYVNNAWVTRTDFDDNTNMAAVSTSWYNPPGAADDWMITPQITLGANSILRWRAKAQDDDFPDGYQVRISTGSPTVNDFNANLALFVRAAELPAWTQRSVMIPAQYANQDVYLAFRNNSNDMFLLFIDDIIVQELPAVDAKLTNMQLPTSSCVLGTSESISVTIENLGFQPLSNFDVSYVMDNGTTIDTVTETVTATIQPVSSFNYTFTQTADLSTNGATYIFSAFVEAAGDADAANNSFTALPVFNVVSYDVSTAYTTGFENLTELLGWSVFDANSDNVSWGVASGAEAYSGDNYFTYFYNTNGTTAANDWLFSTCLDFQQGEDYELSFYSHVGNFQGTIFPEKLKVAIGNSPQIASMTTVIEDFGTMENDTYEKQVVYFTVPTSGTYYLGFHIYSDPDQFYLRIDEVRVEVKQPLPLPTAGFVTGKNGLAVTFSSTSTGADSIAWNFGDGTTANTTPFIHTYNAPGAYYACITAYNASGSDTFCDSVTVDFGIGISSLKGNEIRVYPNPSNGQVFVESNGAILSNTTIVIHDLAGKIMLSRPMLTEKEIIDFTSLSEGIYTISVVNGNSANRHKIIYTK